MRFSRERQADDCMILLVLPVARGLGLLMLHRVGHAAHCSLAQRHNEKQNDQIAKYIKKATATLRNVSVLGFPSQILMIYILTDMLTEEMLRCTSW